jgi:hypothetical protein
MPSTAAARCGALVACLLLAGCVHTSGGTTPPPVKIRQHHAHRHPAPRVEVTRVGLTPNDVAPPEAVLPTTHGDQVFGQTTLDECGHDFGVSEGHRVARRQVAVAVPEDHVSLGNEVVAYDSAAAARHALHELEGAVEHCSPNTVQGNSLMGDVTIRTHVTSTHENLRTLPVRTSYTYRQVMTTQTATVTFYLTVVYQVQGNVLNGNYLLALAPPGPRLLHELHRLAVLTGQRQRQLMRGVNA